MAFKKILIYVQGCEKRKPKHLYMDWMKIITKKLTFLNLDSYLIYRVAVEHRALNPALLHLILGHTCMALTPDLETMFLEALNTSQIYPISSKVRFVKGLANSILTYVPKMIHIRPNKFDKASRLNLQMTLSYEKEIPLSKW